MQQFWTEPMIVRLKALHAEKLSARQIGEKLTAEFGRKFTRNAVIGKIMREGLATPRGERKLRIKGPPRKKIRTNWEGMKEIVERKEPQMTRLKSAPEWHRGVALIDLKESDCRFPWGDIEEGGVFYCGEPVRREGDSWCARCANIVFDVERNERSKRARSRMFLKGWARS